MKKIKIKSIFSGFSLTFRLTIGFILLITFLLTAVGISTYVRDKQAFMKEAVNRGWTTVHTVNIIAAEYLRENNYQALNQMVEKLEQDAFIYQAEVTDSNGKIVAHHDNKKIGQIIKGGPLKEVIKSGKEKITPITNEQEKILGLTFTSPITDISGNKLGYFNLTIDSSYIERHLAKTVQNILLNFVVASLAALFFTRLIILRNVHRPVQTLLNVTEKISTGDFSHQLPVTTRDELGRLAQGFNTMTGHLGVLFESIRSTVNEMNRTSTIIAKRSELSQQYNEKEINSHQLQEMMKQINSGAKRLSRLTDKLNSLVLQFKTER
ncbi:MAG: HAMP domain-containing protein [Desulfotomaculum sp.]|nr:HAMP domain-containing protein [Desulfotomaculum sp.]